MKKGFSLIEILVVLSVFVLLVFISNQIFFSTLKGTEKTQAITAVKQNGNYAVSVIQRSLRNSKGLVSCTTTANKIDYYDADGKQTFFSCVGMGGPGDAYIASGSARLTSEEVKVTRCEVICRTTTTPQEVEVNFTLEKKGAIRVQEKAIFDFKAKVVLRN